MLVSLTCLQAFQLTPSRRATWGSLSSRNLGQYFNSRPHGGRRHSVSSLYLLFISTHALTEGDHTLFIFLSSLSYFNSRPHGGRQKYSRYTFCVPDISTHALTEGDTDRTYSRDTGKISTHALTEGDTKPVSMIDTGFAFQLTPSRRATNRSWQKNWY